MNLDNNLFWFISQTIYDAPRIYRSYIVSMLNKQVFSRQYTFTVATIVDTHKIDLQYNKWR